MKKDTKFKTVNEPASIEIFRNINEIGIKAAERIIAVVRKNPYAVIILPTGTTPVPMYKMLVKRYEEDKTIDFSKAILFNLDEYIGLPENHPLSYSFFMKKIFYDHLDKADRNRAPHPNNRHIPHAENIKEAASTAKMYDMELGAAIKRSGSKKADLVVLGIGGAYPVLSSSGRFLGIKGGHIGFNEPGSKVTDRTRVVKLADKTKLDTSFRFLNLKFCETHFQGHFSYKIPDYAITLGIENILESEEILLLANMEEKSPVIYEAFKNEPNPDFPATFLKLHENVKWMLDKDAADKLPHERFPWTVTAQFKWTKEMIRKAVLEFLNMHPKKKLSDVTVPQLEGIGVSERVIDQFGGIEAVRRDASNYLDYFINTKKVNILPKNEKIMIFSPHPDDDVIDMAVTVSKLIENGNDIWIVYMVNGENAVRNTDSRAKKLFTELYNKYRKTFRSERISDHEVEELQRRARIGVRKAETKAAAKVMKLEENRVIFLDLPYYYRRGLVGMEPIDRDKDVGPVRDLLLQIRPQHIFYSAEADPHGAHGLCAEIISRALDWLLSFWNCSFWGYRGAYEEWPLYKAEDLIIVPFDAAAMRKKIKAVKCHRSQLKPLFPSFDMREFYERARDRNRHTGHLLEQLDYLSSKGRNYAEVFRKIAHSEFIRTK